MKEKDLIIQSTKSLTAKKDEPKELTKKSKNTALVKSATKKEVINKEVEEPKASKRSSSSKKETKATKTTTKTEKKSSTKSKTSSNSKAETNSTKKTSTATKKTRTSTKKTTSRATTKRSASTTNNKSDINSYAIEYFDLPYRYNETIVKLLVQTPKRLFVYWDISDKDREQFINLFGDDFFNKTVPFLRIINESMNYSFDIEINDFANSWYININDENCKYHVELYRKFRESNIDNNVKNLIQDLNKHNNNFNNNNHIFISSSNKMDAPNDKVLASKYTYPRSIEYRNIKTNISSFKVIEKQNAEFYSTFFKDENINAETLTNLPSSRF